MKHILFIINSPFKSGAENSFFDILNLTKDKFKFYLVLSSRFSLDLNFNNETIKILRLNLSWFNSTRNPGKFLIYILSIIIFTIYLSKFIFNNKIKYLYAHSIKSAIYVYFIKLLTAKKMIWHVRDNLFPGILTNLLIKQCDIIISISKHIHKQFPVGLDKNLLIYGGIDVVKWNKINAKPKVDECLILNTSTIIIACVGQFTRWKNQTDFIRVAKIISERSDNVHFFLVGDDLSGREIKYKNELLNLVKCFDLQAKVQFLGHREDIQDIMNSIDVLVHPAINEPFGRVLIEAMAMEKPVVAYNCGGPAEIVVDGETGFLVDPLNYHGLSGKTMELINNIELRSKMGKAGRLRVIEKFNIKRYANEIEVVFDNI